MDGFDLNFRRVSNFLKQFNRAVLFRSVSIRKSAYISATGGKLAKFQTLLMSYGISIVLAMWV
jgi:hypothetical protein